VNVGCAPPVSLSCCVICLASSSESLSARQIVRLCTCRGLLVDTYIPERSSCGCILGAASTSDKQQQAIVSNSVARPPLNGEGAFIFHERLAIHFSMANRRLDVRETVGNFNRAATARVLTRNIGGILQQDHWWTITYNGPNPIVTHSHSPKPTDVASASRVLFDKRDLKSALVETLHGGRKGLLGKVQQGNYSQGTREVKMGSLLVLRYAPVCSGMLKHAQALVQHTHPQLRLKQQLLTSAD
jgi:hypothetical protein